MPDHHSDSESDNGLSPLKAAALRSLKKLTSRSIIDSDAEFEKREGFRKMRKMNKKTGRYNQVLICMQCKKSTYKISVIKDHLKLHSGERSLACKHCDRKFVQRTNLLKHEKLHDDPTKRFYNSSYD